ncbi:DUF742 domain-containing protein [Amycolatopsis cihanbeyliensis]|uniref:Uncharacterized protein DUF742 n=1 Tax=Amycolatopsis cihanbeyliensis TaxID=1128664 RepID=A0A542DBP3_AMYCI|nr:DUF742 domain-containing protein [Amycolatopsis cihanbeyliensis]TQJ00484.1 uncharacterized protein DUF742 [Amycolatopsis cihanbeyliensis]
MSEDDGWYDEAAGPLVRPYTITGGRTPADGERLDLSTQVRTLRAEQEPAGLTPEHLAVLRLCREPMSVAEIAVYVKVPLGVVRVLCGDLIERGLVITRSPSHQPAQEPDLETLQAVLDGLIKY